MTIAEQREAARKFINRWSGKGKEDEDGRSYWIELLTNIFEMDNITERINFEKKVIVNGHTKRIDVYIPETKVLIEQKSLGIGLDQKLNNSGDIDLTPYEQAKRYNDNLPYDEKARWIVTSNFGEIWVYDMNERVPKALKIELTELQDKYQLLDFLVKKEVKSISKEMEVSIKAGDIVGLIYDAFFKQYKIPEIKEKDETTEQKEKREHKLKSLNALCVRIVFCLYAEDAGIFGERNMFHDYLAAYDVKDCRRALIELFKTLDTPIEERDEYLEEDLSQFPYVNGGLFADETIEIPQFTEEIKKMLLENASEDFNWRDISPTIFGAVFESTLNPETRRTGGMHYTSIENIHKVIDPLFLDDLKFEFEEIKKTKVQKTKYKKLDEFQDKLAELTFLDPACGSGNFLTETYLSLRHLENEVIKEKIGGQITLGDEAHNPIKVSIQQFYGIEINDFAVTVAKTALWIAESQMLEETKNIVYGFDDDFLPLKSYVNITEGNALRIDWKDVVPPEKLSYIMGNPPFVGNARLNESQKEERNRLFDERSGELDYVCCWYKLAAEYITDTNIRCAFVSTNSICQGQQVAPLWKPLFEDGLHIDFAHRTFIWDSETNLVAHVYCVIIGFSKSKDIKEKFIFEDSRRNKVEHINGYLLESEDVFITKTNKPIFGDVPRVIKGFQPTDNGHLILEDDEKEKLLKEEPLAEKWIRPFIAAREFLRRKERWCLWLVNASPAEINKLPKIKERVYACKEWREQQKITGDAYKLRNTPALMRPNKRFKEESFVVIPGVSGEKRRYIPFGYVEKGSIPGNSIMLAIGANHYHFGIICSNVHMAWTRAVCGRLESRYRYSTDIVYNNFPWPSPSEEQKKKIEKTAKGILEARELYKDSSYDELYDPVLMPLELRKAHIANDKAVMAAYGFNTKMSEEECVSELMKMYKKLSDEK